MTAPTKEAIKELQEWYKDVLTRVIIIECLRDYFNCDDDKVSAWLKTKNPNFGDVSPMDLINKGRGHKVLEFVKASLKEGE